jgi:hypothetical protein
VFQTDEERQAGFLAFAAVLGGGVVAYTAASSAEAGDWFATDPVPKNAEAGIVALGAGFFMGAVAVTEAAKEVGWKPLVLGSMGIGAAALIVRAIRR